MDKNCIFTLLDDFGFEEVWNRYNLLECHSPSMTLNREVIGELTKLSKKTDVWILTYIANRYGLYSGEHLYNLTESSLSAAINDNQVGNGLASFVNNIKLIGKYSEYYRLNDSYIEIMNYNLKALECREVNIRLLIEPN